MVDLPEPRAPITVFRLGEKQILWSSRYRVLEMLIEPILGCRSKSLGLVSSRQILERGSKNACFSASIDGFEHFSQVWR